jgi:hypothetical protein
LEHPVPGIAEKIAAGRIVGLDDPVFMVVCIKRQSKSNLLMIVQALN